MAVPRPGQPVAQRAGLSGRWTPAPSRSSSSRPSATRLADKTSFPPSRRLAEALEPSDDPVIVRRRLDETDQARSLLQDRPGVGIGSAHDIEPWIGRAVRGGRLDPAQFLEVAETLDATARLADVARRRAAAAAPGARPPSSTRCPRSRSTLLRSFDPTGELLDTASPRLGGAARRGPRSPTSACGGGWTRLVGSELGGALQEPIITLRNGRYVVPDPRRGPGEGQGHRPRRVGQRPDAVRRAARRGRAGQRVARGAARRSARRRAGSSTSCRRSSARTPTLLRETLDALAEFDFWAARAQLAAEMDGVRPAESEHGDVVLLSARHPGLTGRVVPIDLRLGDGYTALVDHRPQHRRQDGRPAHARPARADAPGRAARPGRGGLAAAGASGTCSRTSATSSPSPRASPPSPATCARSSASSSTPGRARSCCSTSSGAGTDPDGGLRARPGAAGPLHPVRRARRGDDPLRRDQGLRPRDAGGPQRVGRVRPRDAVADVPPVDRPAGRQPGVRDRRAAGPARRDRRRRPRPPLGEPAGVRGDPRVDPQAGRRDRRRRGARRGSRRRRPRRRSASADEERRRARRERDESVKVARDEAQRLVDSLRDEVARGPAAPRARDGDRPGDRRRPGPGRVDPGPAARGPEGGGAGSAGARAAARLAARRPGAQPDGRLGGADRRAREGRHPRDARGGRHARVGRRRRPGAGAGDAVRRVGRVRRSAPAAVRQASRRPGAGISSLQLERARSVASSLDLRGARVDEALEALSRYLDDAALAGLEQVLVIHGLGTGALRDAVRAQAGRPSAGQVVPGGGAGRGRRRRDDRQALGEAGARGHRVAGVRAWASSSACGRRRLERRLGRGLRARRQTDRSIRTGSAPSAAARAGRSCVGANPPPPHVRPKG